MTFASITSASALPSEVWVDDDWVGSSPGDIVDGHTFGTDAFATIQNGIDAVNAGVITIEASQPGAQDITILVGHLISTILIGAPTALRIKCS